MTQYKSTSAVTKGALVGLLLITFAFIIQITMELKASQKFGWIKYSILFIGVIGCCIHYANQMKGTVTFSNIFAYGFKVTAIATLMSASFTYISIKFIFPDTIEKTLLLLREKMATSGAPQRLDTEQIEMAIAITRKYFMISAIGISMFFDIFVGAIASLLGAAVSNKKNRYIDMNEINQIGS